MALFKIEDSDKKREFNKQNVIDDIKNVMNKDFAGYKVILSKDDPWDLLLIRQISRSVVMKLGAMGLHESIREIIAQEIFAVNVLHPDEEINEEDYLYSSGWTKAHFIVSDASTLLRQLLENEKN